MKKPIPFEGPVFNQDYTEYFFTTDAAVVGGESIDTYIDLLANAGVRTFVSNINAQKVNYASRVWQNDWEGYDPQGPDTQPFLKSCSGENMASHRNRLDGLIRLDSMGIDFHRRAFSRCRERGVSPWVSIRMNDVHDCTDRDSVLVSRFYNSQRDQGRLRSHYRHHEEWWSEFNLDWELPEVRDHYMALVRERLEQDDVDGLELDWSRFVYHFKPGRELRGGRVLTEWLREVRNLCDEAGKRLGHFVALGMRVSVDPEVSRRCGLDAVAWAREGLLDVVVPAPFCATADFDIPITLWKRLLPDHVRVAGGIDNLCRPMPNGPAKLMTPELVLGCASALLDEGADAVYLFNYFPTDLTLLKEWSLSDFSRVMSLLRDREAIAREPRTYAVTFRDVRAPGEGAGNILPARDSKENFPWPPGCLVRVKTGKRPVGEWRVFLKVTFDGLVEYQHELAVYGNGKQLVLEDQANGCDSRVYRFPIDLFEDEVQVIEFVSEASLSVVGVELNLEKGPNA